jgi:serine/threonine protein kinase
MMRASGDAVLIDFGLARHERLPDLLSQETRLPIGTAPYLAPEQVQGDRSDPRSDLFALGVMLYFFTTGERPFGEPETKAGLRARLYRDPAPPRALNPACPPWLQEIILRCLEVDPSARCQTGAQLAFDLQHPSQIRLTDRAERLRRDPFPVVARRWLKTRQAPVSPARSVSRQLAEAPLVMAAVDLTPELGFLAETLRLTVRRILAIEPAARLTCVNVRKTALLSLETPEQDGRSAYLQRLVELKAWARPLELPDERISFHVLDALDPGAALVDYARHNQVDHIVVGARGSSTLRRYLGSTSSHVVAEAPCSVTVVRVPERERDSAAQETPSS